MQSNLAILQAQKSVVKPVALFAMRDKNYLARLYSLPSIPSGETFFFLIGFPLYIFLSEQSAPTLAESCTQQSRIGFVNDL
jgi:hypothetical protein